jgi:hypothetical protein
MGFNQKSKKEDERKELTILLTHHLYSWQEISGNNGKECFHGQKMISISWYIKKYSSCRFVDFFRILRPEFYFVGLQCLMLND